ncbi:PREDICTED: protein casc4-like isoform X1 [Acropora digitifera]|uniref:protein casc4-like isoform X1 n=1 Tax=Acropora digitifera TaxID=70779 RepID=UPI00077B096D|nr:PREDICTED: protein casc4-like isoform X1 [Acropora digitifera]
MEPLDKARMKVTLNRSRLPAIVVVILVSLVFILAYNYWSLSASNSALRQELRHGENYQLLLERRRRVLESRISEVEAESRSLQGDLLKDREMKEQATTLNAGLKLELQAVRDKLQSALDQERVYREELEKLKTGVNGSSSRLRALSSE